LSLIENDGKEILVCAHNGVIAITLPSLWTKYPLKDRFVERNQREKMPGDLHQGLKNVNLNIELRVADRVIATIGPKTKVDFISKLFGFGPVRLKIILIIMS